MIDHSILVNNHWINNRFQVGLIAMIWLVKLCDVIFDLCAVPLQVQNLLLVDKHKHVAQVI